MKVKNSSNKSTKKLLAEICASLLLLFFVHKTISDFVNIESLQNVLKFYSPHHVIIARSILALDVIIVTLLFFEKTRIPGFIITLLALFGGAYAVFRFPNYPHHFGGLLNMLSDVQANLLYSVLIVLAVSGLVLIMIRSRRKKSETQPPGVVFT